MKPKNAGAGTTSAPQSGMQGGNPTSLRKTKFFTPESVAAMKQRSLAAQDPKNTGGFVYGGPKSKPSKGMR
jgi:hypothetical protein